jgi:hypothetical protein
MMQVSKKIPFENPDVLMGIRALYVISNVIILGIYLYIQTVINKKKGTMPLRDPLLYVFSDGRLLFLSVVV